MKLLFKVSVVLGTLYFFLPADTTLPVRRLFWFGYPITVSSPEILGQQLSHTTWTTSGHDIVFGFAEKLDPTFQKRVLVCPQDETKPPRDYSYECDPREAYKLTKEQHEQLLQQQLAHQDKVK